MSIIKSFSVGNGDTFYIKHGNDSFTVIDCCLDESNIDEAVYGNSKADFISKLHIALKETGESIYWLTLLKRTNLIEYKYDELLLLAEEIKRMLVASLNTVKGNK